VWQSCARPCLSVGQHRAPRRAGAHLTKLETPAAVSQWVQGRRPREDSHHVGDDKQDPSTHPGFSRQPHLLNGDDINTDLKKASPDWNLLTGVQAHFHAL
jgi:hypothetical protein